MTGPYYWINLAEACLWMLLGLAIGVVMILRRRHGPSRTAWFLLPLTLIAFGLSDVVETKTGAWWHPWWLLLWKGACVASLLAFTALHFYGRRSAAT